MTSSAEGIEILGNQRVTLQAAGGSVTLDGADIVFKGPGLFSVKGATHNFVGPGSDADHAFHFHFDLQPRRNGSSFCQ